jgi:hypothetical protein
MTWTKLSDDFTDDCHSLSDAAFRTHVEALIWTMRRETGGYITAHDIRRFAESPHAEMAVSELVAVGWWEIEGQGYRIRHHMEHQPEPDLIAKRRSDTADRVRKHRRKKAGLDSSNAVTDSVTERVTRDGSGRVGEPQDQLRNEQDEAWMADLAAKRGA